LAASPASSVTVADAVADAVEISDIVDVCDCGVCDDDGDAPRDSVAVRRPDPDVSSTVAEKMLDCDGNAEREREALLAEGEAEPGGDGDAGEPLADVPEGDAERVAVRVPVAAAVTDGVCVRVTVGEAVHVADDEAENEREPVGVTIDEPGVRDAVPLTEDVAENLALPLLEAEVVRDIARDGDSDCEQLPDLAKTVHARNNAYPFTPGAALLAMPPPWTPKPPAVAHEAFKNDEPPPPPLGLPELPCEPPPPPQ
jgi:hypothetical protein